MPFDSHAFLSWTNPTGDFRQVFPHFRAKGEEFFVHIFIMILGGGDPSLGFRLI